VAVARATGPADGLGLGPHAGTSRPGGRAAGPAPPPVPPHLRPPVARRGRRRGGPDAPGRVAVAGDGGPLRRQRRRRPRPRRAPPSLAWGRLWERSCYTPPFLTSRPPCSSSSGGSEGTARGSPAPPLCPTHLATERRRGRRTTPAWRKRPDLSPGPRCRSARPRRADRAWRRPGQGQRGRRQGVLAIGRCRPLSIAVQVRHDAHGQARWDGRARWLLDQVAAEGGTTQPASSAACLDRA
jgi:hypothetical protein